MVAASLLPYLSLVVSVVTESSRALVPAYVHRMLFRGFPAAWRRHTPLTKRTYDGNDADRARSVTRIIKLHDRREERHDIPDITWGIASARR